MSYALNIDQNTGRVLSATFPQYAPDTAPQVDTLPDGNLADYIFADGELVYSPPPQDYPRTTEDVAAGRIFAIGDDYYRATMPIPRGEPVTRYNSEPVGIVEIMNALQEAQKGE